MSLQAITDFIRGLGVHPQTSELYVNPYRTAQRRRNLHAYLAYFAAHPSSLMLIGEAPGYRGCAQTGIPFSSPHLLQTHPFFKEMTPPGAADDTQKEPTASIVWQIFDRLDINPLCWNAFPFHPHREGVCRSNRRPTAAELDLGRPFLNQLITLCRPTAIAAVGRAAEIQLKRLNIPHIYIRHPSHGGKKAFAAALVNLANGQ